MGQGGLGGLIPSGGGSADGFYDFLRAAGVLTPRPRIRTPGAPDGAMPDVPRPPEPEVPRAPEPDAPRVDDPDAPRDGRFDGEWEDVNTPWYRNPSNIVPAAMAGGIGLLTYLMGRPGDPKNGASPPGDLTDVGDTAAMRAQQKPLGSEEFRARQAAFRAKEDERRAWLNHRNRIAGGAQNIIGGPNGNAAFWNNMADLPDKERERVMVSMMPMDRNRALVEAQSAERAALMAQRAMIGFLAQNPGANPEVANRAAEMAIRQKDPSAAGAEDIAAGRHDTNEAINELKRLAAVRDSWMFGVGDGDASEMAKALRRPPYNLDQPTAEALAYQYMNRRSWLGISPFDDLED